MNRISMLHICSSSNIRYLFVCNDRFDKKMGPKISVAIHVYTQTIWTAMGEGGLVKCPLYQ